VASIGDLKLDTRLKIDIFGKYFGKNSGLKFYLGVLVVIL